MKSFYRLFSLSPTAMSSHMRTWVNDASSEVLLDFMAMFGCAAMANISMRTSHFACFIVQWFLDKLAPQTTRAQRAFELLAQSVLEKDQDPHVVLRLCLALVGFYIDDWAVLTIQGHELISNQVVTAVWEMFGLPEEPSKTLDFSTS